jgi:hypothetical protein
MSAQAYVILTYTLGLGLIGGYGVYLFFANRATARRDEQCGVES